jgi:hypothetical protein
VAHGVHSGAGLDDRRAVAQIGWHRVRARRQHILYGSEVSAHEIDGVTSCEQGPRDVLAEKAGAAGDKDVHGCGEP